MEMQYEENYGVPSMVLLPARAHHFKCQRSQHIINVPRSGKYLDLAPDFFKESDGEFLILDSEKEVLYLPSIIKVLFATHKYPDLKDNELFAISALIFKEDEVQIIGQIMEMLPAEVMSAEVKLN